MESLYKHTIERHNRKAASRVLPVLSDFHKPRSVIDIGCGTGTWLSVAQEVFGTQDILGLDGGYVNLDDLMIRRDSFVATDLRRGFDAGRRYDLAICLEVAEHLPEKSGDLLVDSLVNASDFILFSAALPGQGGHLHINEQPFEYWIGKFEQRGYGFYDLIRPLVWQDAEVDWWYRQNVFCVVKDEAFEFVKTPIYTAFHPEYVDAGKKREAQIMEGVMNGDLGISKSFRIFRRSFERWISNHI